MMMFTSPTTPPINLPARPPIGRFAPSPTGELHLGSLLTAVASYAHIKSQNGKWRLRIEDADTERCRADHSAKILADLEMLGLHWDGEVVYQSRNTAIYEACLATLQDKLYFCDCSRKQLADFGLYPRFCLNKSVPKNEKVRLILPDVWFGFLDEYQGVQWQNPQKSLGDVVVKRQNGLINYILACAIDDGLANVTSIVRGLDILPMTTSQLLIQQWLGLPTPSHFAHLPLLVFDNGQKLSKQTLATPIDISRPSAELVKVLKLLKMPVPDGLADESPSDVMAFVVKHWQGDWQQAGLQQKTAIVMADV